jgi:hypothetical protein
MASDITTTDKDPLVALLRDPHVRDNVDWGFASGLFPARQVDYYIGRAVDAYVGLEKEGKTVAAEALGAVIEELRHHPQYERYFRVDPRVPVNPEDRTKNPGYKAILSIGH